MVIAAGEVLLPELTDRLGAEVALTAQAIGVNQISGPAAQGATQPLTDWDGESSLRAFD